MTNQKDNLAENLVSSDEGTIAGHITASGAATLIGRTISDTLVIDALVGTGGMSAVYRGRDLSLNREVAIKVLLPDMHAKSDVRIRFQREGRALSQLDHPNIVKVFECGLIDGATPYLVMELADGVPLAGLLKDRERLSINQSIDIITQVCSAASYCHKQNVVHRDLKPGNIMALPQPDGTFKVKVIDFGIAKLMADSEIQSVTSTSDVFGSPLYMSPEQCRGTKISTASDVYSIGCILFECLAGVPPYRSDAALTTMLMHMQERIPKLSERCGQQFPPDLDAIVAAALAKKPDRRYQSASQLAADLRAFSDGREISVRAQLLSSSANLMVAAPLLLAAVAVGWFLFNFKTERAAPHVVPVHQLDAGKNQAIVPSRPVKEPPSIFWQDWHTWAPPENSLAVSMYRVRVDAAHLADLIHHCRQLESLGIHKTTPGTLKQLRELSDLRRLDVSSNYDVQGTELEELPHLLQLIAANSRLDDEDMKHLPRGITDLVLDGCRITDSGVATLCARLPDLRRLYLADTSVTDKSIEFLKRKTSLRHIRFGESHVSVPKLKSLIDALPRCVVEARNMPVENGSDVLRWDQNDKKKQAQFRSALQANLHSSQIREVDYAYCPITADSLKELSGMRGLTALSLHCARKGLPRFNVMDLQLLSPRLLELDIDHLCLRAECISAICQLKQIEKLKIWGNQLDDDAVKNLGNFKTLQALDIRDVDAYGMDREQDRKDLRQAISQRAKEQLLKDLPHCAVRFTPYVLGFEPKEIRKKDWEERDGY